MLAWQRWQLKRQAGLSHLPTAPTRKHSLQPSPTLRRHKPHLSLLLLLPHIPCRLLPADERDALREAMQELLQRLAAANDVIGQADASMASMEEQVAAATEERRQAEEEAAAARAEAEALRETAADLQVGAARGGCCCLLPCLEACRAAAIASVMTDTSLPPPLAAAVEVRPTAAAV